MVGMTTPDELEDETMATVGALRLRHGPEDACLVALSAAALLLGEVGFDELTAVQLLLEGMRIGNDEASAASAPQ